MRAPKAIDVIANLDRQTFLERYVARETPVVLKGACASWPALQQWTPEHLKRVVGPREVKVLRAKNGRGFDPSDPSTHYSTDDPCALPFDRFVDQVFAPASSNDDKLYLRQTKLADYGPLQDDVPHPYYAAGELLMTNLWLGSAGNVTHAHYDMEDNLLAQVRGEKRVLLFSSRHLWDLYPLPSSSVLSNFATVDVEQPDLERHPRFARAVPHEARLSPGDILYIPIYWWHQVYSLTAGISVNFWWQSRLSQAWRVNGLRYVRRTMQDGYFVQHALQKLLPTGTLVRKLKAGRAA